MNSTCEEERSLIYNQYYIAWAACPIVTGILSLIVTGFLSKYIYKTTWHSNIQVYMVWCIFCRAVLVITSIINFGTFLLRLHVKSNPCEVLLLVGNCQWYRWIFLSSYISLTLTNVAVTIDRFFATFYPRCYYRTNQPFFALCLILVIILASFGIIYLVMQSDNHLEVIPQCLSMSGSELGPSMYIMFEVQFCTEIVLALANIGLMGYQKNWIGKSYDLNKTHRGNENAAIIKLIRPLNFTTSFSIGLYTLVAIILRTSKDKYTKNEYILWTCLIFIVPYLPLIFNLVSLYTLRKHRRTESEKNKILVQQGTPNGAAQIEAISSSWNSAFVRKHSALSNRSIFRTPSPRVDARRQNAVFPN